MTSSPCFAETPRTEFVYKGMDAYRNFKTIKEDTGMSYELLYRISIGNFSDLSEKWAQIEDQAPLLRHAGWRDSNDNDFVLPKRSRQKKLPDLKQDSTFKSKLGGVLIYGAIIFAVIGFFASAFGETVDQALYELDSDICSSSPLNVSGNSYCIRLEQAQFVEIMNLTESEAVHFMNNDLLLTGDLNVLWTVYQYNSQFL